jgi:hypothetical protein
MFLKGLRTVPADSFHQDPSFYFVFFILGLFMASITYGSSISSGNIAPSDQEPMGNGISGRSFFESPSSWSLLNDSEIASA